MEMRGSVPTYLYGVGLNTDRQRSEYYPDLIWFTRLDNSGSVGGLVFTLPSRIPTLKERSI